MGRRVFLQHLAEAKQSPPANISNVHSPDEAVVAFTFSYMQESSRQGCNVRLLALNLDDYPEDTPYMLFTEDDHVDPVIPKSFEAISARLLGSPIPKALAQISAALTESATKGEACNLESQHGEDECDSDDDFAGDEVSDDHNFGIMNLGNTGNGGQPPAADATAAKQGGSLSLPATTLDKIKSDLRAAKSAGFRVGVIGDLFTGGIITVSIRVTKLGISEEAMQAWGLQKAHYLVLLLRFRDGYRDLQRAISEATLSHHTQVRVGLCQSYKPSDCDVYGAFDMDTQKQWTFPARSPLEPLFIGRPLNDLFREEFTSIVRFRQSYGLNWRSAEALSREWKGKIGSEDAVNKESYMLPDDSADRALPSIVVEDDLRDRSFADASLPLVAMQFLLRHFVRCTEFCLICHGQMDARFEALKPYVCSKPLCLFQYMNLGFGPTIEWEVVSQPYVVDLLVSFCYAAASSRRLDELPVGIGLKVPLLPCQEQSNPHGSGSIRAAVPATLKAKTSPCPTFKAQLDFDSNTLIFGPHQQEEADRLWPGDWLVAYHQHAEFDYHYQIKEKAILSWQLSKPVMAKTAIGGSISKAPPAVCKGIRPVDCYAYDANFDDLSEEEQTRAIVTILDTVPSVTAMKDSLEELQQTSKEARLKSSDKTAISRPGLHILRWIIASNRSCIMQVDRLSDRRHQVNNGEDAAEDETTIGGASTGRRALVSDSLAHGMDNWVQFRFAQGAPDKEQRFLDCVEKETSGTKYPTLFAWHGSPLANWHSIIRQGLQLKQVLHGNAYGRGIYMSNRAATSISYSGGMIPSFRADSIMNHGRGLQWPNSVLGSITALSLQEVVNKPDAFVSRSPHYVVANTDWIQTRYLFVTSDLRMHSTTERAAVVCEQDPQHQCYNEGTKAVEIPITAIPKSRRPLFRQKVLRPDKVTQGQKQREEEEGNDLNSVASDDDCRGFLESDVEEDDGGGDNDEIDQQPAPRPEEAGTRKRKLEMIDTNYTKFVPGVLDVSSIRFLQPPKDASTSATKALQRALQDALKVQSTTPLSKLGWHINPDHVTNLYQWIVELHSFSLDLPLAKDMMEAQVESIVLEMRFTNQFPFSPPFIRIVRPRFLPFSAGGGGHVTEGGAICMELLTNTGWTAVTSIEMVLLQVHLAISDLERPARLASSRRQAQGRRGVDSYGVSEAVAAYERACRNHGWEMPDGFAQFGQEDTGTS